MTVAHHDAGDVMPDQRSVDAVRSQAAEIAAGWSAPGAPPSWALTAGIFNALARDDDLLAIAARMPPDRMPALLFCAATCYLVAEHEPPDLVDYFPDSGPRRTVDSAFRSALRSFCLPRRAAILAVSARHRYQMTEVARSTQVALALGVIARAHPTAAIALIDLGASAGFGLWPDRYDHRLSDGRRLGDPTSPLVLSCTVSGTAPPMPDVLPTIAQRIGVDVDPIDLGRDDDRRWVRACVPPERESLRRFDTAARLLDERSATILRADGVVALPDILDAIPHDVMPVVVDTYTAVFFADQQRQRLDEVLARYGRSRDLAWVSLDPLIPLGTEGQHSVQGIDVPDDLVADYRRHGVFALLGLVTFTNGHRHGVLLARAHPSGTTLTWLPQ
jgi:hypothetical protein